MGNFITQKKQIASLIQKILIVLFVCSLTVTEVPHSVHAEGEIYAHLGVMTWDGTTNCGSVSLDGGEFGKGWTKEDLDLFNSYDKVNEKFPPCFVMSANGDFLRDQVDILVPELEKNNVEYVVKIYGDDDNVLSHVFHVNVKSDDAALCNDDECEFFRQHMR